MLNLPHGSSDEYLSLCLLCEGCWEATSDITNVS